MHEAAKSSVSSALALKEERAKRESKPNEGRKLVRNEKGRKAEMKEGGRKDRGETENEIWKGDRKQDKKRK